jgi:Flp pilus assembly protein CpaB
MTIGGSVRRRSNLLVLLGIAFFVVGGVIVFLLTGDEDSDEPEAAPVTVVVPTQAVPAGALADELIEAGSLKTVEVPPAQLSPGAVQSLNQLEGATFVQGFAADQQITTTGLQMRSRTFEVPEGYEAVAVQIDFVGGAAGYDDTGDRINLYGVITTAAGEAPVPRAELLLTNVEVLDVNLTIPPRRGTSTDASTTGAARAGGSDVTYLLALRTADVEKVIYTTEVEALYATLTAKDAPPAGPTAGRDSGSILADEPNVAFGG